MFSKLIVSTIPSLLLALTLIPSAVYPSSDFESFVSKMFSSLADSPEFISRLAQSYNLEGEYLDAVAEHSRDLFKEPALAQYFARNAGENGEVLLEIGKDNPMAVREFGAAMMQAASVKGLSRLSVEEQFQMIVYMASMFDVMGPRECKQFLFGEHSATEAVVSEVSILSRMGIRAFRGYLGLSRKSSIAEMRDEILPKEPTKSERELSEIAYAKKFEEVVMDYPNAAEILISANNPSMAEGSELCDFGRVVFDAMLKMEGITREWKIKAFIYDMR